MSQWCSFKIKSLWSSVGLFLSGSVNSPSYGKSGLSAILLSLSFAVIIFSRCFRLHASESALNISSEACVLIHAAVLHHCSHLTDGAAGSNIPHRLRLPLKWGTTRTLCRNLANTRRRPTAFIIHPQRSGDAFKDWNEWNDSGELL